MNIETVKNLLHDLIKTISWFWNEIILKLVILAKNQLLLSITPISLLKYFAISGSIIAILILIFHHFTKK